MKFNNRRSHNKYKVKYHLVRLDNDLPFNLLSFYTLTAIGKSVRPMYNSDGVALMCIVPNFWNEDLKHTVTNSPFTLSPESVHETKDSRSGKWFYNFNLKSKDYVGYYFVKSQQNQKPYVPTMVVEDAESVSCYSKQMNGYEWMLSAAPVTVTDSNLTRALRTRRSFVYVS